MSISRAHLPLAWISAIVLCVLAVGPARADKRMSDDERGHQLYERHCIQCHGEMAAGDGPAAVDLMFEIPDLTEAIEPGDRSDHAQLVLDGRGGMPGFSSSFDKYDAKRVMRHMERACRGELFERDEEEEKDATPAKGKGKATVLSRDEDEGDAPADGDDAPTDGDDDAPDGDDDAPDGDDDAADGEDAD